MSEFIITIEQIENLVMQSSAEAIDAYKFGIVKWNWQYPLFPEIIRCRDCRYYRFKDRSDIFHDERHNDSFCLRFIDGKRMEVESDGFCAWGERKEN